MRRAPRLAAWLAVSACAGLAGCGGTGSASAPPAASSQSPGGTATAPTSIGPSAAAAPVTPPGNAAAAPTAPRPAAAATLAIPAIGVRALRVVPYTGAADDAPGTKIQNGGLAASPRGRFGGVGPGEVGNYIVTAHRTTAGRPFGRLPAVPVGAQVLVTSGGLVYDYRITETLTISFRSAVDRRRQSAPVPGRLGQPATRPMITLSTCATPEDHAAGNYWKDQFGNPEHRIDKVGVLVGTRPA